MAGKSVSISGVTMGIIALVAGILVLVWPHFITFVVGIFLIAWGILAIIKR